VGHVSNGWESNDLHRGFECFHASRGACVHTGCAQESGEGVSKPKKRKPTKRVKRTPEWMAVFAAAFAAEAQSRYDYADAHPPRSRARRSRAEIADEDRFSLAENAAAVADAAIAGLKELDEFEEEYGE
jgi:hypothetical protein